MHRVLLRRLNNPIWNTPNMIGTPKNENEDVATNFLILKIILYF